MSAQSSMLHVRVNDHIKNEAAEKLEGIGLTLSDAVRILLTRIAREGGLPPGLVADNTSYDAWFKAKVHEALDDTSPTIPHEQVMDDIQVLIDRKRAHAAR
jgi:DNA-damage-inducible protein J